MKTYWKIVVFVSVLMVVIAPWALGEQREITIAVEAGRQENATLAVIPEFQKLHPNINVKVIGLPSQSMVTKLSTTFAAKSSAYDCFALGASTDPSQYAAAGWLFPLDKYIAKEKDYFKDYFPVHVKKITLPSGIPVPKGLEGKYYGLPYDSAQMILFYRKDLYEKKGLKIPKTWDEFIENAIKLNDPTNKMYGAVIPGGTGSQQLNRVVSIAISYGGIPFLDKNNQPKVNSKAWIKALQKYSDLIHKHKVTPPGVLEYQFSEQNEAFLQGMTAQMVQYMVSIDLVEDPKSSKVAGKVGYAPFPGGNSIGGCWMLGISPFSKNPDDAWELIKFINSKDSVIKQNLGFTTNFIRKSAFNDPRFIEKFPNGPLMKGAIEGVFVQPQLPVMGQIRQILQEEVGKAVSAQKSPKDALDTAQVKITQLLKEAGFIK